MTAPLLEPVEERILQNLETTLAAISPTSLVADFYTLVKKVHAMDRAPSESLATPCIVLVHQGTEHEFYSEGLFKNVITLEAYCILVRTPTWRRDIVRFASDVRRAVMIDHQRGQTADLQANAFDTIVSATAIGNLTDGKNTAVALLPIQITYRDSIKDPTQAA